MLNFFEIFFFAIVVFSFFFRKFRLEKSVGLKSFAVDLLDPIHFRLSIEFPH